MLHYAAAGGRESTAQFIIDEVDSGLSFQPLCMCPVVTLALKLSTLLMVEGDGDRNAGSDRSIREHSCSLGHKGQQNQHPPLHRPGLKSFSVRIRYQSDRDGLSDSIADGRPEFYCPHILFYLTCPLLSVLYGHAFTQREPELLVASNRLNQTPSDVAWSPDSSTFLLSVAKGLAQ